MYQCVHALAFVRARHRVGGGEVVLECKLHLHRKRIEGDSELIGSDPALLELVEDLQMHALPLVRRVAADWDKRKAVVLDVRHRDHIVEATVHPVRAGVQANERRWFIQRVRPATEPRPRL